MSAIVRFEKVSKRFGKIIALDEISFEVEEGEFVFLTGPSGAGKTTILNLLIGDIKASSGRVFFDGQEITKIKRKNIPYLRKNIEVALAVIGVAKRDWKKRVNEVLELVGLGDRSELFPQQLSGGEVQRVAIARALVVNPKILLADEPTGNLDWDTAQNIVDLLSNINNEGKTVMLATHHEGIVYRLKKRTIRLEKGAIAQ